MGLSKREKSVSFCTICKTCCPKGQIFPENVEYRADLGTASPALRAVSRKQDCQDRRAIKGGSDTTVSGFHMWFLGICYIGKNYEQKRVSSYFDLL